MSINIAIDGPSGAGKSTIARRAAEHLGFLYVDTGAMYRAVALYVVNHGAKPDCADEVEPLLENIKVELKLQNGEQRVLLNGEDVSDSIRTPAISMAASAVSAIPKTREFLLSLQKDIAKAHNVIMDGRDIGTVVLPDADVKIFLTAAAEERAKRRFDQLCEKGEKVDYDSILADIKERDYNDTHRETAPLKKADDAVLIDSTEMTLEEASNAVISAVQNALPDVKPVEKKASAREYPALRPVTRGKKTPLAKRIVHEIMRLIAKLIYYIYLDLHFEGLENVPKDGSNIFASNHRSYTDPILISLKPRVSFSFMAKEELFKQNVFFATIIKAFGAFPVTRGSGGAEAIDTAIERLNKGYNLVIFPEGTRSKDGKVLRGKTGVALVAAMAQVPVIPTGIVFEGKIKFRRKVTVKFGKPIIPSELGINDCTPKNLKKMKNSIMESITELVEGNVNKL